MLDDFCFERIQCFRPYLTVSIAERSSFAMKTLRPLLKKTDMNVAVVRIRVQSRKPRYIIGIQSCRNSFGRVFSKRALAAAASVRLDLP